jgi:hypothetical protein
MRLLLICFLLSSCSFKQFYPTGGAIIGGGLGSLAGPAGSALGAGGGALVGEIARGNEELEEATETIELLTHGDVSALVEQGMRKHETVYEQFIASIRKILMVAAVILLIYLCIPIIVAKRCSKTEAEKSLTRAPFVGSRGSYPRKKPRDEES